MTTSTFKSINLLPAYFQTDKNSKFLSSTLDQLIQPAQLERVNGYIGTKVTPTYNSTSDFYISETRPYQLAPALVVKDIDSNVQDVVSYDDLYNEIDTYGGLKNNLDRLFRSEVYSYDPYVDLDKLINYQEYFWLITGPDPILITDNALDVDRDIVGQSAYSYTVNSKAITLSNGMLIKFNGSLITNKYKSKLFFVEGVGTSIKLIDYSLLETPGPISTIYNENFDADTFDSYPFDGDKSLPVVAEYVTINRASRDLNPWSRYNRWVHKDVIAATALANGLTEPVYPASKRARRPIIEFNANLKLFNFGTKSIGNVDYIDTTTLDAFSLVEGSAGFYIDIDQLKPTPLENGQRVIFNADTDPLVRGKIYEVRFNTLNGRVKLSLVPTADHNPNEYASVSITKGKTYGGTSWWFNGSEWVYAQQHTKINQAPLFDLFDNTGVSYANPSSNFAGNKIFSYSVGTGPIDSYLGFPLNFRQAAQSIGSYIFENNFSSETISITQGQSVIKVLTSDTYAKFSNDDGDVFGNSWSRATTAQLPILQFYATTDVTTLIKISVIDNLAAFTEPLYLEVFVDSKKINSSEFSVISDGQDFFVNFTTPINANKNVLLKLYTSLLPNATGHYELPLGLTNNPLNSHVSKMTLTDLQDHAQTMVNNSTDFSGTFPGSSNIRDISNLTQFGTRLVSHANPIAFSQIFLGKKEHSIVSALSKAANQYNQFKLGFLKQLVLSNQQNDPVSIVDNILKDMNLNKNSLDPYYFSDMAAYGTNFNTRKWTVTSPKNKTYPISTLFDPTILSLTSTLVYLNGTQLLLGSEYTFDSVDSTVNILADLNVGDVLVVNQYPDTTGNYIPPTPTKLGLYPKFTPKIYLDKTFVTPTNVIQGHDGSITVAYNDYRDAAILELEKRIYNNIKTEYKSDLFDVTATLPGAFRQTLYSSDEAVQILRQDFVNWSGLFGINHTDTVGFDEANPFTWNYAGSFNSLLNSEINGSWRSIYKYFYDTDRPNLTPWEMLGFSEEPSWWSDQYGHAPYTSGNEIMWQDIEAGRVAQGPRAGIQPAYARPGLAEILPVDDRGNLNDPTINLLSNYTPYNIRQNWNFGDQGPVEAAWRRSSFWPFAVQRAMALMYPATYASLMYDVSRVEKNIAGQWTYGSNHRFLSLKEIVVPENETTLSAGYSVYVVEVGKQRNQSYVDTLKSDINYLGMNLFHKVGGFVSKDSLTVVVDAIDPTSTGPGALLSSDDYSLILNVSNPVKTARISGVVIQRSQGRFVIKGYDLANPYFNYYPSLRNSNTPTINVGGITAPYVTWTESSAEGSTGLNPIQTTTARAASSSIFYHKGQYVKYNNNFYLVTFAHQSGSKFEPTYFQKVSSLPLTGGATVQTSTKFDKQNVSAIPYGTEIDNIQDLYDIIIGYGAWLEDQGFIFDDYNSDFAETINWYFTAKEFLYWSTQKWNDNSIITLSPFANQIQYSYPQSVVDNIFDSFYDYKILNSSGAPITKNALSVTRNNGVCTISSKSENLEGIYFAVLRSVQKEHGIIFNNTSIFKDVIYDVETGFYQRRMLLNGFRTSDWNGDYFSPGFIYDTATISKWTQYKDYSAGSIVYYSGNYYSSIKNLIGTATFNFNDWMILPSKPKAGLLPNFDYKINQFSDFYNLDIDNFDAGQQKAAQHLTGYTPRPYLNNIIKDPIAQYKFYQGFIKEKGTKNAIDKLSRSTIHNHQGNFTYNEEWAFRIGKYGSYTTYQELEFPLTEGEFIDNPQIIVLADRIPDNTPNNLKYYSTASDWQIVPDNYISSSTFASNVGTFSDNDHILYTSGYVRMDDVTYTSLTKDNLIDYISNTDITFNEGDTFWIGEVPFIGWDVLRYTLSPAEISSIYISNPDVSITVITNKNHNISAGEIISISNYDGSIDGVYTVVEVPSVNSFTILSSISYVTDSPTSGVIHRFTSVRFNNFDNLPDNKELLGFPANTKIWIDNDTDDRWAVYEKTNNYSVSTENSIGDLTNQQLGWSISKRHGSNVLVAGAPGYSFGNEYGRVVLYLVEPDGSLTRKIFYNLDELQDSAQRHTIPGSANPEFGYSVLYDDFNFSGSGFGLIFAGAPGAETVAGVQSSGLVKVSSVNYFVTNEYENLIIYNPSNTSYSRFGSSMYVQRNATTSTDKLALISAPGTISTGTGAVYVYSISANTGTLSVETGPLAVVLNSPNPVLGGLWGNSISGSDDASIIAISQVGNSGSRGFVKIYEHTGYLQVTGGQLISSPCLPNAQFGKKVLVSPDGQYLFVGAPTNVNYDQTLGAVIVYKNVNGTFVFDQAITNPVNNIGLQFGIDFDISPENDSLIISSLGNGVIVGVEFENDTMFDGGSTLFYDTLDHSGTAYIYNKHVNRFVIAQELSPVTLVSGTDYGKSVVIDTNNVFVGAPSYDNNAIKSSIFYFNKLDTAVNGWTKIRTQPDLVTLDKVKRVMLVNTSTESVTTYLDIFDPLKGKIPGIADQEITYKLGADPAIYSIGAEVTSINTTSNWTDLHVGELWWDLSTAKYQWYEQGDDTYRKNHWGQLFPGASIDVYEWVKSPIPPSEWATVADTAAGLALGYSGYPLNPNDSVYSYKIEYNTASGIFDTVTYYFWVRNKVTVPNVKNRRTSAYDVAFLINDPTTYGLRYASIISPNSITVANVAGLLKSNDINLNISLDDNTEIPKHTEWALLQEGLENSIPNDMLVKKLFDSLLGHDDLGNPVPDPSITPRLRQGIEIRPRQSMFKDRLAALRNLVGYANSILAKNIVTGKFNFSNLNAEEEIPSIITNLYDKTVEDSDELSTIDTVQLTTAELQCTVDNGKIRAVQIINAGYGYLRPPTVSVASSDGSGAIITTIIDSFGRVVSAKIDSSGSGYFTAPDLTVRPFTVYMLSDSINVGKWSKYEYDTKNSSWVRRHTQSFKTSLYWNYADWKSDDYNQFLDYTTTVNYVYETDGLLLLPGNYVRVKNNGLGNYIILKSVVSGGTYNENYDIVFSEKGTIQISDIIWNQVANPDNYDQTSTYDQILYDQTPNVELKYILTALRDNIFTNELKVYWNLFFFRAVKYAFTEQKLLDWAFKTSFVSITNNAGELTQPPVYKLTSSTNFEQYINEVKPYHTQLRTFTENYNIVDPTNSLITDTDWTMNISMKFDRFFPTTTSNDFNVVDNFICDGSASAYELSWLAEQDKKLINVTLDGLRVLWADYTVKYFTREYNGYTKKFCKLVFLNFVPAAYKTLQVSYAKSLELLSATERIENYYSPAPGNPGLSLGQLMSGIEYPNVRIDTIPFNYSTDWDYTTFNENTWGNNITYYSTAKSVSTSSTGSNVISLNTASGISVGQRVNVISTTSNIFHSNTVIVSGITGTNVTVSSTLTTSLKPGSLIEFWSVDSNASIVDSAIDGGDLGYTVAVGTGTTDIIIDGKGFYTADAGHAPEELVPGKVSESLGINVYTKISTGAPTIYSGVINVTGQQIISAPFPTHLPLQSLIVTSGNSMLFNAKTEGELLGSNNRFLIDITENVIKIHPTGTGTVTYSIVDIGGGSGNDAGVIDHKSIHTIENSAQVVSLSQYGSVQSAYVEVMGTAIPALTTSTNVDTDVYYVLGPTNSQNNRAAVTVYNLTQISESGTLVSAWFFASKYDYFNKASYQFISASTSTYSYALNLTPGNIGPVASQVRVEQYDKQGGRTLLIAPETSYYKVSNSLTFAINSRLPNRAPPGSYRIDNNTVEVYVNGIKIKPGFDYTVDEANAMVMVSSLVAKTKDVIAVVDLYAGYNFNISGNIITFVPGTNIDNTLGFVVHTFTNHDGMLIQTDLFAGTPSGRFKLSRSVANTNYVWVWLNSVPLRPNIDYAILSDGVTLQLSDLILTKSTDSLSVQLINDQKFSSTTLAYRIFNDMFNRVNYKRISSQNSTYLTQPLTYNDTEIHINDATAIIPPNPFTKVPGVVVIAGERIEFYKKDGPVLSQLRRATLGTSPKHYVEPLTQVIDQSPDQTIPYSETILKQVHYTTSTSKTYSISTTTLTVGLPHSTSTVVSDGITLAKGIAAEDQIEVYYGGRPLNKRGVYYHDANLSYDSPVFSMIGNVASTNDLPKTKTLNDAYIDTSTNQVWVFTNSLSSSAVNGYEYKGMKYLPPEFSINTSTNEITLNTLHGIRDNIKLVMVKKQVSGAALWNNGVSLLDSTSEPAIFLQSKTAQLPDVYYQGDLTLTTDGGFTLTDSNDDPLEGF